MQAVSPTLAANHAIDGAQLRQLQQKIAKDEALLNSIGDAMVAVDKTNSIFYLNQQAQQILDIKLADAQSQEYFNVIKMVNEDGSPIEKQFDPIQISLSDGGKISTNKYFLDLRQGRLPVMITSSPVLINDVITGAVALLRDISREKEIDKAKTEFVSLASHQLRTPLATINWYAEMLLSGDAGPVNSEQKNYLEELYHANQRMVELVNSLLDISRIELGTFSVSPIPTNFTEIAKRVLGDLMPMIKTKEIIVTTKFNPNLPLINADPKLIEIIIQNLLSNSVKYTPPHGKISVEIFVQAPEIVIKINDTGLGIPQRQQSKIFTKLFRADNVMDKEGEGTGLGLYIVKSIIDHCEGKIWFSSQENQGTSFYVALPLSGMKAKRGAKNLTTKKNVQPQ